MYIFLCTCKDIIYLPWQILLSKLLLIIIPINGRIHPAIFMPQVATTFMVIPRAHSLYLSCYFLLFGCPSVHVVFFFSQPTGLFWSFRWAWRCCWVIAKGFGSTWSQGYGKLLYLNYLMKWPSIISGGRMSSFKITPSSKNNYTDL